MNRVARLSACGVVGLGQLLALCPAHTLESCPQPPSLAFGLEYKWGRGKAVATQPLGIEFRFVRLTPPVEMEEDTVCWLRARRVFGEESLNNLGVENAAVWLIHYP